MLLDNMVGQQCSALAALTITTGGMDRCTGANGVSSGSLQGSCSGLARHAARPNQVGGATCACGQAMLHASYGSNASAAVSVA